MYGVPDRLFASAHSSHPDGAAAVAEVVGAVLERVGPAPDLAVLFVGGPHAAHTREIAGVVRTALMPGVLLGAMASAVVGDGVEMESEAAVSLWAGRTGPVTPLRLRALRADRGAGAAGWRVEGWPAVGPAGASGVLVLTDPFSFPAEALLADAAVTHPGLPLVGGLASGGDRAGSNTLVLDGDAFRDGAVAAVLGPGCDVETVVSQGCRPVGDPYVVTRGEGNLIMELGSRPALARFQDMARSLSPDDQALLRRGVHIGHVIDEHKHLFARGDFLVRDVLGADRGRQAIAIGGEVSVGATVQFHVRDGDSAHEDLEQLLAAALGPVGGTDRDDAGALLFTCTGRGRHLFGRPHHDAAMVRRALGSPLAGMFCAGEIGPIGGRPFLHGYTASLAVIRRRERPET